MEPSVAGPAGAPRSSVWMTVLGVLFLVCWIGASVLWFAVSMMGALMANDSGAVPGSVHTGMLLGVIGGQILTTLSGIAGGLAFFRRRHRRLLLILFVVLLTAGGVWQYQAFQSFVAAAGWRLEPEGSKEYAD